MSRVSPTRIRESILRAFPEAAAVRGAAWIVGGAVRDALLERIWQSMAEDPNVDSMRYAVSFRSGSRAPWILLKDDISELTYEWDTRTVSDGRYEVRVTASDALANAAGRGKSAARVSDPIVVDNTAPVIGDLQVKTTDGKPTVSVKASDRTSALYSFEYSVDSAADWQTALPSDNICDSPEESASFPLTGLKPGTHQVAVRVTDAAGNQAVRTVTTTIDAGKK